MANLRESNVANRGAIGRNRRRIEVFLEGKDDLALFGTYWCQSLNERVDFRCAEEGPRPLSGCTGVRENVRFLREVGGVAAFGILDRDAVLDDIEACEIDDAKFLSRNTARDPYLYYTLYWEVENYLVRASALEETRCDGSAHPEPCRPLAAVHSELREHCDTLVPHAAINAHRHRLGKPNLGDGATDRCATRQEVDVHFRANHLNSATAAELTDYEGWMQRIDAFDRPHGNDEERVASMQRRIHGKAILHRFFKRRNIQSEMRWHVARKITPPDELRQVLEYWISTV